MTEIDRITSIIESTGFSCTRCGTCCSAGDDDANLVMVTPEEIRKIMGASGQSWDAIAEPYPEKISREGGQVFTIGWCLVRRNGICGFYENGACRIYEHRPWICRTYPFSLDGDTVLTHPCPSLGCAITRKDARAIARDLIQRKHAEHVDEEKIRRVLKENPVLPEKFVVIDNEGMKEAPQKKPPDYTI
jgi:Fe-S-cluster containining protein